MAELVYVDNSNVFIEGMRAKAVVSGRATIHKAMQDNVLDKTYKIDFGRLHEFVAGNVPNEIKRCMLFGSRPPPNDSLWAIARRVGFEVVVEDRNVRNQEKRIDTGIVTAMIRDAYTMADKSADVITLVAGDGDYVPPVRTLVEDGFRVEVVFWSHASSELKVAASKFVDLNPRLNHLAL